MVNSAFTCHHAVLALMLFVSHVRFKIDFSDAISLFTSIHITPKKHQFSSTRLILYGDLINVLRYPSNFHTFLPFSPRWLTLFQGRRTQRTTRTTAVRDNENANARPGRISTRAKPLSSTVNNGVSTMAGSKATGSKAEVAVSKRKREVLGENAVVAASSKLGKGKDDAKQFDGVVINKTKISTRQPLRSLASSQQPQHLHIVSKDEALKDTKERPQPSDDHAMAVDPPIAPILPSLTIRRSLVPDDNIPRRGEVPKTRSSRLPRVEEDPEINRVFKKRRTSSEAPEDSEDVTGQHEATLATQLQAELDAIADEVEADPDGDHWDDLDAEDAEDPAMCSEYVVEVFEYYRQIEVRFRLSSRFISHWPPRS